MALSTIDINDYIERLNDKMINIKTVINLIHLHKNDKGASLKKMNKLCDTVDQVIESFETLTGMKNELNKLNKELEIRTDLCNQYTEELMTRLETEYNRLQITNESSIAASPDYQYSNIVQEEPPKMFYHPPLYRPKPLFFDVEELTECNLDLIPKYMIGKLNLTTINDFIQYFNKTVMKKYVQNKKSSTYVDPTLKKETFVTESDLYRDKNNCLTKQDEKILMILCNMKKLTIKRIEAFKKRERAYIVLK